MNLVTHTHTHTQTHSSCMCLLLHVTDRRGARSSGCHMFLVLALRAAMLVCLLVWPWFYCIISVDLVSLLKEIDWSPSQADLVIAGDWWKTPVMAVGSICSVEAHVFGEIPRKTILEYIRNLTEWHFQFFIRPYMVTLTRYISRCWSCFNYCSEPILFFFILVCYS